MDTINTKQDITPNSLVTYLEGCYFFCGVLGDDAFCKDAFGNPVCFNAKNFLAGSNLFTGTLDELIDLLARQFGRYEKMPQVDTLKMVKWAIHHHASSSNAETT